MKRAHLRVVESTEPSREAACIARIAHGDVGAVGELYDTHASSLLRFATRLVGSDDAEDVVQETFLRVARVASSFDTSRDSARPWLFGIAANVVRERKRAFARFAAALSRLRDQPRETGAKPIEPATDIARALEALSVAKRTVLVLAELEGFTGEEIAGMLDVPVGTVWTRLHHARRELRASVGGES